MNRVRRVGKLYQCLISPYRKYDPSFEYLLESWTDESVMGFEVRIFSTLSEAECVAIDMPDINWDTLVDFHKDSYLFLRDHVAKSLEMSGISVDFKPYLASPIQTKNRMFDRVLSGQDRLVVNGSTSGFRMVYDMNDIISFIIVNPWMSNLKLLSNILIKTDRLRIFNKLENDGIIQLVGRTDIGTTYEIILVSSIIYNWIMWRQNNPEISPEMINSKLKNCIRSQKLMDNSSILR